MASPAPTGMVWIPGGTFRMGSDRHYPEEAPVRSATVAGFWMDRHPVRNCDFERFVAATGHVTMAEVAPNPTDYPGALPHMLRPGSMVFAPPARRSDPRAGCTWWTFAFGADWRHPTGPDSSLAGLDQHPVVHLAFADVTAYSRWAGKALPTETEWEFAARGGLDGASFAWGEQFTPEGRYMANTWQGEFPWHNQALDGYARTSPVNSFPPNGFGLHDMIGNVWEWTTDWYNPKPGLAQPCCAEAASYDPHTPDIHIPRKVLKGGSHLCAPNYCRRYRPAARFPQPVDTSACHVGFRCILRAGA